MLDTDKPNVDAPLEKALSTNEPYSWPCAIASGICVIVAFVMMFQGEPDWGMVWIVIGIFFQMGNEPPSEHDDYSPYP